MPSEASNYKLLLHKLDDFTRKYYLNALLRGSILFVSILLVLFLSLNIIEYFFYLSSLWRKVFFFGFILLELFVFVQMIALPLFHYFRLGKIISRAQAAEIIGRHFSEVEDRLLNILQLEEQKSHGASKALIEASINQKAAQLKPIAFNTAIDLKQNKKYLPYFFPPVLIFLFLIFAAPNLITESTSRIVRFNESFERPAPFTFTIQNENLQATQSEDFEVTVKIEGEVLPKEVHVQTADFSYKMRGQDPSTFIYTFKQVQKSQTFRLYANGYYSKSYELVVLPRPSIQKFQVQLDYPGYTSLKNEVLKSNGDLSVPEGTFVTWNITTREVDAVNILINDSTYTARRSGANKFDLKFEATQSTPYEIVYENNLVEKKDTIVYYLDVIQDAYPRITVKEYKDSTYTKQLFFTGEISDDYGLSQLKFKYRVIEKGKQGPYNQERIGFDANNKRSSFNYLWDFSTLNLQPGDQVSYFFEVWDNDAINGSKSSKSNVQYLKLPGRDELEAKSEKANEQLKEKLEESIKTASEIQKQSQELKERLLRKSEQGWEDKKQMEQMLQKQKELEKNIEALQKQFDQNQERQKEFKELNPELKKKQEKLKELFDQVMNEEMKELFEKMESMLEKMSKEEAMDQLEDVEMTNEQLENELDRMYELFKKFELEQKMQETLEELEELAQKQEELKNSEANSKEATDEQKAAQEEISESIKDIKEDIEKSEQLAEEAKEQVDMSEMKQSLEDAEQQSQQAGEQLGKQNQKKAKENQQNAQDSMEKAAQQMSAMMQNMQMQQMGEDLQAMRQLLENLLLLSDKQEDLSLISTTIATNNPAYVQLIRDQNQVKDNTKIVTDSLQALAKRVFSLQTFINEEISGLTQNLENSIKNLAERQVRQASVNQQRSMTHYNNLALMLSESMDQMQQQMAMQMPGSQQCQQPKPGQGKPSLSEMQKQMNKQLSEMQEQMKKDGGQKPGGKNDGKGKSGMSKELAKMAAQQAAIRQALQKLNQQENADGKNTLGDLDKLQEQMNKTETDLVNKQLSEQMMERQQEILTRLLEAEDAMRQREFDEQRKSVTSDKIAKESPPSLEEYLKQREAEIELYKTLPPSLKPYYKDLVESYFKRLTF